MSGEGIVMAPTDLAEVDRRSATLQAEMAPKTLIGSILVHQLATLSVRMERGAKQEFADVAARVRHATEAFDLERFDEIEAIFQELPDNPERSLFQLRRSTAGVAKLIQAWQGLRADLTCKPIDRWSPTRLQHMAILLGLPADGLAGSRVEALTMATWGQFERLAPEERTGLEPSERKAWARSRLIERIDAEIAELNGHLSTIDPKIVERDRAEAADRALFDASPEARLARRYESEARRCFFKALKEFRQVEADAIEQAEPLETPEEMVEMASSRETSDEPTNRGRMNTIAAVQSEPAMARNDLEAPRNPKIGQKTRRRAVALVG
jgi:hypothetical protein